MRNDTEAPSEAEIPSASTRRHELPLTVSQVWLTLHGLHNLPSALSRLDARTEWLELVLLPTVRYYYKNQRMNVLQLPEHVVAFSPAVIEQREERYFVDMSSMGGSPRTTPHDGLDDGGFSKDDTSQRDNVSYLNNGTTSSHATLLPAPAVPRATHEPGSASHSTGRVTSSTPYNASSTQLNWVPTTETGDKLTTGNTREDDRVLAPSSFSTRSPPPSTASMEVTGTPSSCWRVAESGCLPAHMLCVEFPSRADLKVIVEVLVGVRQRCLGGSAVRWITSSVGPETQRGQCSYFAAAEGEVMRYKIVNRFVDLGVGNLICAFSVPHVEDDLRFLCDGPRRIAAAAARLAQDERRLAQLHNRAKVKAELAGESERRAMMTAALARGESELALYKSLLTHYDPTCYVRRVQSILDLYPANPHTAEWVTRGGATELVAQYASREEELLRRLCAELGPEFNQISPRTRNLVHRYCYKLTDEQMQRYIEERYAQSEHMLDYEPDLYMQAMVERTGPEVLPWRYMREISYPHDNRMFFYNALRCCGSRALAEATAAVATGAGESTSARLPLMLTPNERPLKPTSPVTPGFKVSDIQMLLSKYRPEFNQIIPPIAEAMEMVVKRNENMARDGILPNPSTTASRMTTEAGTEPRTRDEVVTSFGVFESNEPCYAYMTILSRLANYTYISPSSMLAAVIYLDRICLRYPDLVLTRHNIERLFVMAVRVASKVVDVRSVDNKNFANVFKLSTEDVNEMETQLLVLMSFNFFLGPEEFNLYSALLRPPQFPPVRQGVIQLAQHHHILPRSEPPSQGSRPTLGGTSPAVARQGSLPRSRPVVTSGGTDDAIGTAPTSSAAHSPRTGRGSTATLPPAVRGRGVHEGENNPSYCAVNAASLGGGAVGRTQEKAMGVVGTTLPRTQVPSTMRC